MKCYKTNKPIQSVFRTITVIILLIGISNIHCKALTVNVKWAKIDHTAKNVESHDFQYKISSAEFRDGWDQDNYPKTTPYLVSWVDAFHRDMYCFCEKEKNSSNGEYEIFEAMVKNKIHADLPTYLDPDGKLFVAKRVMPYDRDRTYTMYEIKEITVS